VTNRAQPAGAFPFPGGPGNARGVAREPGPAVPRREQAREPAVPRGEQTRARYPDEEGFLKGDGARVFYEVYGTGEPAILLLPTWEIVHSRVWKAQIPYFARYSRVITFDRLGNGRSDRPEQVGAYDRRATAGDARAVLEHAGVEQAVVVSWCGAGEDVLLAAEHPELVSGLVLVAPDLLLTADPAEEEGPYPFEGEPSALDGWAKWNRQYWLRDWKGFLSFVFTQTFTEPHSTKQIEDAIGWGLETSPEVILRGMDAAWLNDADTALRLCAQVRCPTLVLQGSADAIVGPARGAAVAAAIPNARLVTLEGSGHAPHLRDRSRPTSSSATSPARPGGRPAGAGAGRDASARCTSPRRSASATPCGTSPSRGSCARSTQTSRSTGWPSIR
jgi:pimeloyl-ACP methyl ester carboxylesterase